MKNVPWKLFELKENPRPFYVHEIIDKGNLIQFTPKLNSRFDMLHGPLKEALFFLSYIL
jgi:hypothetical protein